jgi:hypothetical protein
LKEKEMARALVQKSKKESVGEIAGGIPVFLQRGCKWLKWKGIFFALLHGSAKRAKEGGS